MPLYRPNLFQINSSDQGQYYTLNIGGGLNGSLSNDNIISLVSRNSGLSIVNSTDTVPNYLNNKILVGSTALTKSVTTSYSPLVEYLFNEASSGQSPLTVASTLGNHNLTITTVGSSPSWTQVGSGRGLKFTVGNNSRAVSSTLGTGTLRTALNGSKTGTLLANIGYGGDTTFPSTTGCFGISSTGRDGFSIYFSDTGGGSLIIGLDLNIGFFERFYFDFPQGIKTICAVLDTNLATSADRLKLYVDGVFRAHDTEAGVLSQNSTLDIFTTDYVFTGAVTTSDNAADVAIYYGAIFGSAFTTDQITTTANLLNSNNDVGISENVLTLDVGTIPRQNVDGTQYLTRTLPTTVNNYVEIGTFVGTTTRYHSLIVSVNCTDTGGFNLSVTKTYLINTTNTGDSVRFGAISSSKSYDNDDPNTDFDLEGIISGNNLTLRLVRTVGSGASTATITIVSLDKNDNTFTPLTGTGTSSIIKGVIGSYNLTDIFTTLLSDPSGWAPDSFVTVSLNVGTRTLTVTPTSNSFYFYIQGRKYVKYAAQSVVWSTTEGRYFFYFDNTGTLVVTTDTFTWETVIKGAGCPVWFINWDNTNSRLLRSLDERHTTRLDGTVHWYLHTFLGTQLNSGGTLSNFTIGNGSLDSHIQFSVSNSVISDEDITFTITDGSPQDLSPIANLPVFYLSGSTPVWRFKPANAYPVLESGASTTGYTGGSGRIAYNQFTGGAWQLTEVSQSDYMLMHVALTTDQSTPAFAILGQNVYTTQGNAQSAALTEASAIQGLLLLLGTEAKLIATYIVQTASTYSNTVKARIIQTSEGGNYVDLRKSVFGQSASSSSSAGGTINTIPISMINTVSFDVQANNATWGALIVPSTDVVINSLRTWVYQTGTGNVQGGLYNADTNALIATTTTTSASSTGIITLSFSSPQQLAKGQSYYLAISCTANGSRFVGSNAGAATFNLSPKPSFKQLNSQLPATLTPAATSDIIWISAVT